MRFLLFFCMTMMWSAPLPAEELRLLTGSSETWFTRYNPQPPATDREILALRATETGSTVTQDRLTAYYIGQKDSFDLVTVEESPESPAELGYAVTSHKIRDGKIWGDTHLVYVFRPNPEKRRNSP